MWLSLAWPHIYKTFCLPNYKNKCVFFALIIGRPNDRFFHNNSEEMDNLTENDYDDNNMTMDSNA